MPTPRPRAIVALLLSLVLAASAATAGAARIDEILPLRARVGGELDDATPTVTYGFLVSEGKPRRMLILAKRARRSRLAPRLRLFDPTGTEVDPRSIGGRVRANARVARINLSRIPEGLGGMWRVEVGAGGETSGSYALLLRGADLTRLRQNIVVPAGGEAEVPFQAGAGVDVTITVRRERRNRTLVPEILVLDPNGAEIPEAAEAAASVAKRGRAILRRFVLPVYGEYVLRVGGVTGFGGGATAIIRTRPSRFGGLRPSADPGPGLQAEPGTMVRLDATASAPGAGGGLSYLWTQVSGDPVSVSDPTAAMPTFTAPPQPGPLAFDLGVAENGVFARSAPVVVDVGPRPVADAGASQRVGAGALVTLDASDSFSRSGQPLSYSWRQISGDGVEVDGTAAVSPTFTAPTSDGTLRFGLTVEDGTTTSFEDEVVVRVAGSAQALADAGREQYVGRMSTVHLSGLRSQRAAGLLSDGLAWTQISGPGVVLDGGDSPYPSFTAPRAVGDLLFELRVDGDADAADRVWVHVRDDLGSRPPRTIGNGPLQADAGPVLLDVGGSSDADGDPPHSHWAQIAGPAATLSSSAGDSVTASFPAGDEVRVFAAQARDDLQFGPPDLIRVAPAGFTLLPLANAGSDLTTTADVPVVLNGSASTGATTYSWRQVSGRDWYDVANDDPGFDPAAAQPTFTLPAVVSSLTPTRTLTFELVVGDGASESPPDLTTVTFAGLVTNGAPSATVDASDPSPRADSTITLIGSVSDYEGDPVTVQWTQTAGPLVDFVPSRKTLSPQVTVPDSGTLTFQLVADDGFDSSRPAEVTIVVDERPTAATSVTPTSGEPGTLVTVSGASSTDPEDQELTYDWTQLSGPGITFDQSAESFQFTAPSGAVTFQLVVSDGKQTSAPALASFSNADPPVVSPSTERANAPYGATVILSANPPQGTNYTFTWRQIDPGGSDPTVTLTRTTSSQPPEPGDQNVRFTVPLPTSAPFGAAPEATFGVVANDGMLDSEEKTVKVTFFASLNDSATAGGAGNTVFGLVQNNCLNPCHSGNTNSCPPGTNGNNYPLNTKAKLLNNSVNTNSCGGAGGPRIDGSGKDPSNSYFVDRLKGIGGTRMPRGRPPLSTTSINLIEDWISQGAQDN